MHPKNVYKLIFTGIHLYTTRKAKIEDAKRKKHLKKVTPFVS